MIVSIDSGSSYLKLFHNEGLFCEPALIEEVGEKSGLQEKVQVNGKWYVAGKRAEQQKNSYQADPELGNFHGTEKQLIQWTYAFEKGKIYGDQKALIVSLPYDIFSNDEIINIIRGKKEFEWTNSNAERKNLKFDNVFVVPQGVGALALYRSENNKLPRLLTLIDIGSCTTDIVSVVWDDDDKTYVFKEKACSSIQEISTSVFIRKIRDKINEKRSNPVTLGYHEIARSIQKDEYVLQIGSNEIDFKECYEQQRQWMTKELSSKLSDLLGDAWRASNEVVLTGGGASFVLPWECEKRTKRMDIYSNVKGQILIAKDMLQ